MELKTNTRNLHTEDFDKLDTAEQDLFIKEATDAYCEMMEHSKFEALNGENKNQTTAYIKSLKNEIQQLSAMYADLREEMTMQRYIYYRIIAMQFPKLYCDEFDIDTVIAELQVKKFDEKKLDYWINKCKIK